jgi:cell volume regulation protein A
MEIGLLLIGTVILICILMNRFLERIPVPSLLIFIALGMCFGENGLLRIPFDDYAMVDLTCSVCLIFIMFYGGFGTNLQAAGPVMPRAVAMSTFGVVGTTGAVALFSHYMLALPWVESFLIGAVISSTDAASVFNILRSGNLALKEHTDSLLEIESGSNDPISYMLTSVAIALLSGREISVPLLLAQQVVLGVAAGVVVAKLAVWLLGKNLFISQQSRTIFLFGVMLLAYALPAVWGGNGYLSVYLCGIFLGNANLTQKKYLVHFFDVLTNVAQVILFFLLGLLVTPAELPKVLFPAAIIMVFLTLVARPVVTFMTLLPFRSSIRQIGLVSWAGLRGAASIVFAIAAVLEGCKTKYNLFNLVFCIVLLSILLQGTLLPWIARALSMIDKQADIRKTFTDYQEESDISFIKMHLGEGHAWCGKTLQQADIPADFLVAMILRGEETIVPGGATQLEKGDLLVLAARSFEDRENIRLREIPITKEQALANQTISQVGDPKKGLILLIKRGQTTLIPSGDTQLLPGDILVVTERGNRRKDEH